MTTTPATTTPPTDDRYTTHTALSDLYGRHDGPGDRSGGLDRLVTAAHAARDAYREIEEQEFQAWRTLGREHDQPVVTLLRGAHEAAFQVWQQIERAGLPLLQTWQRETLGYSESEITH